MGWASRARVRRELGEAGVGQPDERERQRTRVQCEARAVFRVRVCAKRDLAGQKGARSRAQSKERGRLLLDGMSRQAVHAQQDDKS